MTTPVPPPPARRDNLVWQLPAEAIAVRIRWFGLCVGYLLVNVLSDVEHRAELNAILALGAVFAFFDTLWGVRGQVFLNQAPLFISAMEAVFIGLLCWFDQGLDSPFRFYYFLSLLVCAMRYAPWVTYSTFALHALSFTLLAVDRGVSTQADAVSVLLMLVFMGWVTWASAALGMLMKAAAQRLAELNTELQENQRLLENRIVERTRELQASQALLVQHEKQAAFGLLAAGIAHEVGNPLAAISSIVQLMNRKPLEPDMHDRLGLIDEQLRRIQRILRELLDFSRPAAKAAVRCSIEEVIQAALNVAKYYKRVKGRTIDTDFAADLPRVWVVRDQLQQVLINLVLNALDATDEGGRVTIVTRRVDHRVQIDVLDDGVGIPPEAQPRLYEPYFTTKETGTGLGLFVCRRLMNDAGGDIRLMESAPGRTLFRVELPAAEETDGAAAAQAGPLGREAPPAPPDPVAKDAPLPTVPRAEGGPGRAADVLAAERPEPAGE